MHDVIEGHAVLHQVVDAAHDAKDAEGEDPHPYNSDNRSVAADEPT
jgi:hypothetical protein